MTTIVWYIYSRMKATPVVNGMGWAAAGAVVLFFIIMLFTMVNLYVSKKSSLLGGVIMTGDLGNVKELEKRVLIRKIIKYFFIYLFLVIMAIYVVLPFY